jgi:putative DNA primase/helicase
MLLSARTEPHMQVGLDELDTDPFLLACANGTLDLRTGELRPHNPANLVTRGTNVHYNPDAECQRWLRFLEEVFQGDEELIAFVRRAVGYTLTGDTRERVFFVLHGAGKNGKSKFIFALQHILGVDELARTCQFDSFLRSRNDKGVREDLARLHRARLAVAIESGEDRRLDAAIVKQLAGGGDRITCRFLYKQSFEYVPEFKIWLVTNHLPRVDGDDDAIWDRLRLIPFEVSFEGREDKTLEQTLAAELPGILAWAVRGCLEWQRDGLGLPPAVAKATNEYRQDEDVLGAFLAERCTLGGDAAVSDLYEAYEAYCKDLGERPMTKNRLGRRLRKRGVSDDKLAGIRTYLGISLRP